MMSNFLYLDIYIVLVISEGLLLQVKKQLPRELEELWPLRDLRPQR
jgi:hypothetical protein